MDEASTEITRLRVALVSARAEVHELQKLLSFRDREQWAEAAREFRREAFALVSRELQSFRPTLDVRVRSDHFAVSSIEECSAPTLLAAIDELRKRSA
jgi:hypothetical protein